MLQNYDIEKMILILRWILGLYFKIRFGFEKNR